MASYSLHQLADFITADWNETPPLPPNAASPRAGSVNIPLSAPDAEGFAAYVPIGTDAEQVSLRSDHDRFKRVSLHSITAAPPLLLVQFRWPGPASEPLYLWLADMRGIAIEDLQLLSTILWAKFLQALSQAEWPTTH